ncbi:MAG: nuclear transport factor 2 family protein [Burkholderiaceae bacterium]
MNLDTSGTLETLVDTYCQAWSESDPQVRRQLLARIWAADATYTDPTVHAANGDELLTHITGLLTQWPGARIERVSAVDAHHGCLRFSWRLTMADGNALPDGLDFVDLADDGRIRRVVGFFGPLSPR